MEWNFWQAWVLSAKYKSVGIMLPILYYIGCRSQLFAQMFAAIFIHTSSNYLQLTIVIPFPFQSWASESRDSKESG